MVEEDREGGVQTRGKREKGREWLRDSEDRKGGREREKMERGYDRERGNVKREVWGNREDVSEIDNRKVVWL